MMKRFNLVVQALMLVGLFAYSIYSISYFVKHDRFIEFKDCGTVVGSSSQDRPIKHGTQTELYLLIKFEKEGFKAQDVSPTTFFQYKDSIGKKLCFNQSIINPEVEGLPNEAHYMFGILFIFVYIVIIIAIFISWFE